jgi:hypothetical protein
MLYYRFPGEDLQRLEGDFISTESIENHDFIITDFNQEKKYFKPSPQGTSLKQRALYANQEQPR